MKKAILLGVAALCMASCGSSSKENAIQRLPSDQNRYLPLRISSWKMRTIGRKRWHCHTHMIIVIR